MARGRQAHEQLSEEQGGVSGNYQLMDMAAPRALPHGLLPPSRSIHPSLSGPTVAYFLSVAAPPAPQKCTVLNPPGAAAAAQTALSHVLALGWHPYGAQVAALTWIKNHIEGFGGDPTRVTVRARARLSRPHPSSLARAPNRPGRLFRPLGRGC